MEIGLRLLAFIIDAAFCFGSIPLIMGAATWVLENTGVFGFLLIPFWFVLFLAWPFIYFGIPTGLWGRTLGRLVCCIRVTDLHGDPPGIPRALGREVLKLLAVATGLGAIICLMQVIYQGATWYDNICGTTVVFKRYVRRTKTQREFLKHYKENR